MIACDIINNVVTKLCIYITHLCIRTAISSLLLSQLREQYRCMKRPSSAVTAVCYSAPDRGAEYCDDRICVFVREHIYGNTRPIFTEFLCMLCMVVVRSSSGGVAIRYVLPVVWMMSYLCISKGKSTWLPS